MLTDAQKQFTQQLFNATAAIRIGSGTLSEKARLLITAHGCYECGYGRGSAYRHGFNAFNITAGSQWIAQKKPWWTEVNGDVDGQGRPISQNWRAYPDLASGVLDYWTFLDRPQYKKASLELLKAEPSVLKFVTGLREGRYFELDPNKYWMGLSSVLKEVTEALAPTPAAPKEAA